MAQMCKVTSQLFLALAIVTRTFLASIRFSSPYFSLLIRETRSPFHEEMAENDVQGMQTWVVSAYEFGLSLDFPVLAIRIPTALLHILVRPVKLISD